MGKYQALLIHSPHVPLTPVQKLLEEREFYVHPSRGWEEAEHICALIPAEQIKYVFVDITLCEGDDWEQFKQRTWLASDAVFINFHPQSPHSLAHLLNRSALGAEANAVRTAPPAPVIVGERAKFQEILDLANRYARYDITVLITGETGAGKEVIARYIHAHSARRDKPLVACNMTAIPETLVESELFGCVKGAFTGADRQKKGLIEAAEGGTLFLDEIGDLPLVTQLKLLRFLEVREFYKVGESSVKTVDVRIIAATNKNLEKAILENGFREDLYYRLNSARIMLPPLRARREDILLLAETFVDQVCRRTRKPAKIISQSVQILLSEYPWPGNIRELRNVIESAVMVSDGEYVTVSDLPMHLQQYATGHREEISAKAVRRIDEAKRDVIEDALRKTNGDKGKAAELLGISLRTLYRKLEKFPLTEGYKAFSSPAKI